MVYKNTDCWSETFCLARSWYDLSILGMITVAKFRGHTNFVPSKMYEGYVCSIIVHSMDFGRVSSQYDFAITS